MPVVTVNGIQINHEVRGSGPLVVLIMGTGSPGRVWDLHQTPALVAAGYRVCTFDNRGIAPSSESAGGMTIADLVADTAALIEHLGAEPAVVVGTSMGARVAQELALTRPQLVRKAVFLAGHARLDQFQKTLSLGEHDLDAQGDQAAVEVPRPPITAVMNLSPATLADSRRRRRTGWTCSSSPVDPDHPRRAGTTRDGPRIRDRISAYRRHHSAVPVDRFRRRPDDPAVPSKEVANAIPGALTWRSPTPGTSATSRSPTR